MGALISHPGLSPLLPAADAGLWPRDGALGTRRPPDTVYTCKPSRMSLSEISVAKDLIPVIVEGGLDDLVSQSFEL